MRGTFALVAVMAACSFTHGRSPTDATGDDAAPRIDGAPMIDGANDAPSVPVDAMIDAPDPVCHVGVTSLTGIDRGRVGGNGGGNNFPPLVCANQADRIVGVALRMSNQTTGNGGRSAHAFRIACAPVTVQTGSAVTGAITTYEVVGTGTADWTPSTWTPLTQCKPGWILSGLTAHTGSNNELFVDVSIHCSEITVAGTLGASELIYVMGSLDESQGLDTVDCNAGEIVVRIANRTGAGFDSANLWCTTPTCN